ncbi:MAG: LLM class F420-dependent oxidoreductase [Acidimicrobiia bacterium]|nr:LLM class F420-dependent oxidoreductase [Acidimicrobiia bacterium]
MRFGFSAPFRGPLANARDIRTIAEAAETYGYGMLSVADHIVVPATVAANYPYSETGEFAWTADGSTDCMEQFTLLAWLAAVTTDIRLLTSVVVVPHRNPLFMAKSIATTDQLSGGRVTVGCGAGWMREEFEALNIEDFDARGRVTDEYIAVMQALWQEPRASFHGEFIDFTDVAADPKPVQRPHPPIWIGGESMAAIRRTVALGDGWYPFGSNPKFRMDTISTFVARRDRLFAEADEVGRDPASIELAYNCAFHDETAQDHRDGGRLLFTGSAEQRAEDITALAEIGVATMMINVTATDLDQMLERMQSFSEQVMPLLAD